MRFMIPRLGTSNFFFEARVLSEWEGATPLLAIACFKAE